MEIERINENTVKFYISYLDIEDRGFEREEIWYNRERSEQLFWQMMDEINYKEDFSIEGPLWIQVQALEKGLEVIVTKAKTTKDGNHFEFPKIEDSEGNEISIQEKAESLLEKEFHSNIESLEGKLEQMDSDIWVTVETDDFEHIIQLSHRFYNSRNIEMSTSLYHYDDKYYLYVELSPEYFDEHEDVLSQIFEHTEEVDRMIYFLKEYGTCVIEDNVFEIVKENFPL